MEKATAVTIPDVNLLLYAYDQSSPFHSKAARWWEELLSGSDPVGLPLVVLFGFLRISTSIRVFSNPFSPRESAERVKSWLVVPNVQRLDPGQEELDYALATLAELGTGGNLVTDAQIAAAAIKHNGIVHTADADFLRFSNVRWFNPITGLSSANLRHRR